MLTDMFSELWVATLQTIYMVFMSGFMAVITGIPLGVLLIILKRDGLLPRPLIYQVLAAVLNAVRSVPFIILLVAIIPLTRLITGTSIGINAAIVPLSFCAMPFMARVTENALQEVPYGLIEAGLSMGASPWQIICRILLPEALSSIISGITLMLVTLTGYAAMAGAIGGGGLGDLAIRYGYQRFDTRIMMITVAVLIFLVQLMQYAGDKLAKRMNHRAK